MQYAICRHAISLNIILVKPTKCTLSKMHKMHIGILARMPFLAPTSYPFFTTRFYSYEVKSISDKGS